MIEIPLERTIIGKNSFNQVTSQSVDEVVIDTPMTIEEFKEWFDTLFYLIPKEDNFFSHRYMLDKIADYLGVTVQSESIDDIIKELTQLREEVNINIIN